MTCPFCRKKKVYAHAGHSTEIKDFPAHPKHRPSLVFHYHGYKCRECGQYFTEDIPEKIPHAKIHWKTVKKIHLGIMDEFLKKRKEVRLRSGYKPTYLAVDEFAYTKPPLTFYDNIPYLLTLLRNWILCLPRF